MSYERGALKEVGFWRGGGSLANNRYPAVESAIDWSWSPVERAAVLAHLQRGRVHESYRGWSDCRICHRSNGSRDMTDGTFVWPEGFAHYVRDHGVRPPDEFVQHVLTSR